jgi:hypothetical protein
MEKEEILIAYYTLLSFLLIFALGIGVVATYNTFFR